MYIILMYDISVDEKGTKRWKKVFGVCKRYLTHIQKSVFEGELTEVQLKQLENELKHNLNLKLDSVIIFKSRSERWLEKKMLGLQNDVSSPFL